jgi:hypothetical protein
MAFVALVDFAVMNLTIPGMTTPWALKPLGPAHSEQGFPALFLRAVLREKVDQAQPFLELDFVFFHGVLLLKLFLRITLPWLVGQIASYHEKFS